MIEAFTMVRPPLPKGALPVVANRHVEGAGREVLDADSTLDALPG